eukprot:TRINITY_DN1979_c0_g2_i3.p1 TRINITY_DN1979_c0_g2~~TRINITY_DN1979_c0_g2_i3.p1  ORF type:complete len:449 (+),score=29.46 TRINITY_DN1979_c0_g2_i3:118-1464(+)
MMGLFSDLEESIVNTILIRKGFCNQKWKLRHRTQLRCLSRALRTRIDETVSTMVFDCKERINELALILASFPRLTKIVVPKVNGSILYQRLFLELQNNADIQRDVLDRNIEIEIQQRIAFETSTDSLLFQTVGSQFQLYLHFDVSLPEDISSLVKIARMNEFVKFYLHVLDSIRALNNYDYQSLLKMRSRIAGLDLRMAPILCANGFLPQMFENEWDNLKEIVFPYEMEWSRMCNQRLSIASYLYSANTFVKCGLGGGNILNQTNLVPANELVVKNDVVTAKNFTELVSYPYLDTIRRLHFPYLQNDRVNFRFVCNWASQMQNLVDLDLRMVGFNFVQCQMLNSLTNLTSLCVGWLEGMSVEHLDGLDRLTKLTLVWKFCRVKYSTSPLIFKSNLSQLRTLVIDKLKWRPCFEGLNRLGNLERIQLLNQSPRQKEVLKLNTQADIIIE